LRLCGNARRARQVALPLAVSLSRPVLTRPLMLDVDPPLNVRTGQNIHGIQNAHCLNTVIVMGTKQNSRDFVFLRTTRRDEPGRQAGRFSLETSWRRFNPSTLLETPIMFAIKLQVFQPADKRYLTITQIPACTELNTDFTR
jgi:hypothetical protein